jgi:hypothetical protein
VKNILPAVHEKRVKAFYERYKPDYPKDLPAPAVIGDQRAALSFSFHKRGKTRRHSHPQPQSLKNGFLPVSQLKRAALHWAGSLILYSRFGSLSGLHAAGAHALLVHATPVSEQLQVLQPSSDGNDSPAACVFPPCSHVFP